MEKLIYIAKKLAEFGITSYEVGGSVRNEIMGLPIDDTDICLVGVKVPSVLNGLFSDLVAEGAIDKMTGDAVGNNFPNWTGVIDKQKVDFALARIEKKVGDKHQDFACEIEDVTIEEDLFRRDLTINAIAKNMLTGEIVDPYGGREDIKNEFLHPVSDAFEDDDLRVIRAARFWSYFPSFRPTDKLFFKCMRMNPEGISKERIGGELKKVLEFAEKPSKFFEFLRIVKWLEPVFPELHACLKVPQSPIHHPEGDVFTHIMHTVDAADGWFFRAVMLCHDLGKATTTTIDELDYTLLKSRGWDGYVSPNARIKSAGHEEAGVPLTMSMLGRVHFTNGDTRSQIAMLVRLHMLRATIDITNHVKMVRRTLRKLMAVKLSYIDLMKVIYYDLSGRPPLPVPDWHVLVDELYGQYAHDLEISGEMRVIVTGDMLTALGLKEGRLIGEIKAKALELQDRGVLTNQNWKSVLRDSFPFFRNKVVQAYDELLDILQWINQSDAAIPAPVHNGRHFKTNDGNLITTEQVLKQYVQFKTGKDERSPQVSNY